MTKGKIVKNYIYNTLYQVLVLIAPLITTPYVSRVLGVTNIGVYQYSQSVATYFVLIGAVGTNLYGQREIAYLQNSPEKRTKAFWEIVIFRMFFVLFGAIIYFLIFGMHGRYELIYQILTVEIIAAAFDISWLFMGMENFKVTVIRNSIIKFSGILCVFLFVKSKEDLPIYTVCVTLPAFLGNFSLWFSVKKYIVKVNLSVREIIDGIKTRIRPILVLFLPQIAADVYLVLDKTMIGLLASDIDQVGYYSQAQKIVKLVLTIVTSLGAVMLPAMSAAFSRGDNEEIISSIKTAFKFIYLLSFSLLFGLCAVAPCFVPLYFGKGYDPVVPLMIVISPILVIIATSNVLGKQYLLPTKQQKIFTMSIICGAGVNFILNCILIPLFNAVGASIATVIAELAVTVVQCVCVRKQIPLKDCLISGIRYAIYGLVMFVLVSGLSSLITVGALIKLIILVTVGVIIYSVELLVARDPMVKQGIELIKNRKK